MTKSKAMAGGNFSGRRSQERRVSDIAVNHADRRKGDRRSGHDRRQAPRHVAR